MPLHVVEADLASGELVRISAEDTPPEGEVIAMSAIYRTDGPPGPAGRWFIDHLKQEDAQRLEQKASPSAARIAEAAPRNTALFPRHRVLQGRSQEMRNE
jgi:hypothetical protein